MTLLGHLARQQQDYERAKERYRESLAIYRQLGNATYTAWCRRHRRHGLRRGKLPACNSIVCRRRATCRSTYPTSPAEQDDFDKVLLTARAQLETYIGCRLFAASQQKQQLPNARCSLNVQTVGRCGQLSQLVGRKRRKNDEQRTNARQRKMSYF